jgi:hypothetical protein
MSEPGARLSSGKNSGRSWMLSEWRPAYRRREAGSGSCMERENLSSRCKRRRPSGRNRKDESTDARHRGGVARRRVEGSVMGLDRRGCVAQPRPKANRQREELRDEANADRRCSSAVEHREPYEARVSRAVLGAPGGEIPPDNSPAKKRPLRLKLLPRCYIATTATPVGASFVAAPGG